MLALHSIFGVTLQRSLEILEKHPKFIIYTNPKGRTLIEVQGDNGRCYRVFPKINFCPCLAFKNLVIERKTEVSNDSTLPEDKGNCSRQPQSIINTAYSIEDRSNFKFSI